MDNLNRPYPARSCDPRESGVLAHYTFGEGEIAQFARYLNHHADYGAVYDLTTRTGTPGIGLGGGVYARDDAASLWSGVIQPVGSVSFGYDHEILVDATPSVTRVVLDNGVTHRDYILATGNLWTTVNGGGNVLATAHSIAGRGPCFIGIRYANGVHSFWLNGRLVGSEVRAAAAPAGQFIVRLHGETRRIKTYLSGTVDARASYVREFARELIGSWRPNFVGEGPAGGIVTGSVGEGDWYAPLGAAALQFAWRPASATMRRARLGLTGTTNTLQRISLMTPRMPVFGAWLFVYQVGNPAMDNPIFALTSYRDSDPTAAGVGSYRVQQILNAGLWRTTFHRDNGASQFTFDHAAPVAGDVVAVLLCHRVNGTWSADSAINWRWLGDPTQTAVDVTYLGTSYVQVAPRGSYVLGYNRYQGEMTSPELPAVVL